MSDPISPPLSGWCSPCVPRAHATCSGRIAKRQLDGCGCQESGGHETPVIEGDIAPQSFATTDSVRDNKGSESDPALRQQPGSWPTNEEST